MQDSLFGSHDSFCVDTSSWVDYIDRYPPDVFPSLWRGLSEAVLRGEVAVPKEVHKEIKAQSDELAAWFKLNPRIIVALDECQASVVAELARVSAYKSWIPASGRNAADPFVVALAKCRNMIVVTSESQDIRKLKIPRVCNDLGVASIATIELLRRLKMRF